MIDIVFLCVHNGRRAEFDATVPSLNSLVAQMGLSDLALSTEARYTRHPALTDPVAPFMDHIGAIEHFPSGSFMAPSSVRKVGMPNE